jgi:hypothetical protein
MLLYLLFSVLCFVDRWLSFRIFYLLTIVLSVLLFTVCDYPFAIFKLFFTNCETNPAERSTNSCRRPEAFRIEDFILASMGPCISSLFVSKSYALSADLVLFIALEYWWRNYFGYCGLSFEYFLHFVLSFFSIISKKGYGCNWTWESITHSTFRYKLK